MTPNLASISALLLFLSTSLSHPVHRKYLRTVSVSSSRILKDEEQAEENPNDADEAAADVKSYEDWMAEVGNETDDREQMIVNDSVKYESDDTTVSNNQGKVINWASVENIKGKAESSAWAFWSSPPSEWNRSQWNMLFLTIATLSVTLCCLVGCFAYCCVIWDDDVDEKDLRERKLLMRRPRFKLKRRRMILRRPSSGETSVTSLTASRASSRQSSFIHAARSHSTADSCSANDKAKPLLQQGGLIKNTKKKKSGGQRSDRSTNDEPSTGYFRMKV